MLKKFAKNQATDQTLNQVQDALVGCLNPLLTNPLLDYVIVTGVALKAGTTTIANPILRNIQGLIVIRKNGFADIHTGSNSVNPTPTKTIIISSSAAVLVDLYIF